MYPLIRRILFKVFPKYSLYAQAFSKLIRDETSYLYTSGWMRSSKDGSPVDVNGHEVPWMNYPVINFLQGRLKKDFHLFEFGSGYSTLFFARLVGSVTSVEHDEGWLQKMRGCLPGNVELMHRTEDVDGEYCRAIHASGQKYDVVIIDGRDRVNCIRQSLHALSARGTLVLDDSHREQYIDGIEHVKANGFLSLSMEGLKPKGVKAYKTTIFYRQDNCFGI